MCYNRVELHDCDAACYAGVHRKHCDDYKRKGYCNNSNFNGKDDRAGGALRQETFVDDLCKKAGHKQRDAAVNKTK